MKYRLDCVMIVETRLVYVQYLRVLSQPFGSCELSILSSQSSSQSYLYVVIHNLSFFHNYVISLSDDPDRDLFTS